MDGAMGTWSRNARALAGGGVGELDDLVAAVDDLVGDGDRLGQREMLAEMLDREGQVEAGGPGDELDGAAIGGPEIEAVDRGQRGLTGIGDEAGLLVQGRLAGSQRDGAGRQG